MELLAVPDVAQRLKLSHRKVWDLIRDGELPSVKIHTCRRVISTQLDEFIASLPTA